MSQAKWGQSVRDTITRTSTVMQQNEERERERDMISGERERENVNNIERNTRSWPSVRSISPLLPS
jgi:hypothetical protein